MREKLASMLIAAVLGFANGSTPAMSSMKDGSSCKVIGGEKLPADSGGEDALCLAIANAVAIKSPGLQFTVEVTVLPRSRLSAVMTSGDGDKARNLSFSSMDRGLKASSFKRFAEAIANELSTS
jgi:hypothetical protein